MSQFAVVPDQISQLSYVFRGNEASAEHILFEDIGNPFRILLVGLLPLDGMNILRMDKNGSAGFLQDIPNGNPVFPRGFHADIQTMVLCKPFRQTAQIPCESREAFGFVRGYECGIRCRDAGDKEGFVDINSTTDGINDLGHSSSSKKFLRKPTGTGRSAKNE